MAKRNDRRVLPAGELASFSGQVALVLGAGIPLHDGMESIAETYTGGSYERIFKELADRVELTGSLHEALKEDASFPQYLTEMVGVGEEAGRLEEVMQGLEEYYEREERIRSAAVSAVTYPMALGAMLVVIVLVMLWKVLPVFNRVLSSMGVGMTDAGSTMMRIGSSVGWAVLVLVGICVLFVLIVALLMKTKKRAAVSAFLRRLFPPLRRMETKLSSSRVATVLSMMISGGFATDQALEMSEGVLDDPDYRARISKMREEMSTGRPFTEALADAQIFDPLHTRMVRMSAEAGREDQAMAKIANVCEQQVEDGMSQLISVIEPTLVALLAVVVGAILLSVMLPMAGILTSLL